MTSNINLDRRGKADSKIILGVRGDFDERLGSESEGKKKRRLRMTEVKATPDLVSITSKHEDINQGGVANKSTIPASFQATSPSTSRPTS